MTLPTRLREQAARREAELDAIGDPETRAMAAEWRSVETDAPPHNEPVLLFLPCTQWSKPEMQVGCYSSGSRNGPYSSISYHGRATHWMPLPTPPVTP